MDKQKIEYADFLSAVSPEYKDYVNGIHSFMLRNESKAEIKQAKSGYVVSYIDLKTKKAIFNYIFRKKGMMMRIYANHIAFYESFLDTLPEEMKQPIKKASDCKRMLDPDACNSRCAMGYDFYMDGERYQKCRNMAFQFFLSADHNPYLKKFIEYEVNSSYDDKA